MKYSIQHIETILHAQRLNTELYPSDIHHVTFDSRKIIFAQSSIFFAFKSTRNDGHDFIPELYEKGIRNFVISKKLNIDSYSNANFLLVEDSVLALQQLARYHRKKYNIPVIGITGSNGKTIIKEWLFQLLEKDYNIVRSPRSFNSQIGVPISVLQMDAVHDLAIFEAGISKTGEMHNLVLKNMVGGQLELNGPIEGLRLRAAGFNGWDYHGRDETAWHSWILGTQYENDYFLLGGEWGRVNDIGDISVAGTQAASRTPGPGRRANPSSGGRFKCRCRAADSIQALSVLR